VSRKSERLVNLTIALLATKRYLTKSEIFRTIEGYEGSTETKERMFERDKDDLRKIGIEIEVGSFDPLFEDEPGYRIKPEKYQLQLPDLSQIDVALLSIAASAWQGAALNGSALSGLVKLQSLGIESDLDLLPALLPRVPGGGSELQILVNAITNKLELSFNYRNTNLEITSRKIQPYAIASNTGNWYLVGYDLQRNSIRTFKTSRIVGEIESQKPSKPFSVPSGFVLDEHLVPERVKEKAFYYARSGKANALRAGSQLESSDGDWDLLSCEITDVDSFVRNVLWHGSDVVVAQPLAVRDQIISSLGKLVSLHG